MTGLIAERASAPPSLRRYVCVFLCVSWATLVSSLVSPRALPHSHLSSRLFSIPATFLSTHCLARWDGSAGLDWAEFTRPDPVFVLALALSPSCNILALQASGPSKGYAYSPPVVVALIANCVMRLTSIVDRRWQQRSKSHCRVRRPT